MRNPAKTQKIAIHGREAVSSSLLIRFVCFSSRELSNATLLAVIDAQTRKIQPCAPICEGAKYVRSLGLLTVSLVVFSTIDIHQLDSSIHISSMHVVVCWWAMGHHAYAMKMNTLALIGMLILGSGAALLWRACAPRVHFPHFELVDSSSW